jgi:putative transposase
LYRYKRGECHNSDKKYHRPKQEVRKEFLKHLKRYGSCRIKASLTKQGIKLSRQKVAEFMRADGLRAIQPPKFVPRTTDGKHGKRICSNLLLNQPEPTKPNQVWVSDITYMPLKNSEWISVYLDGLIYKSHFKLVSGRKYARIIG